MNVDYNYKKTKFFFLGILFFILFSTLCFSKAKALERAKLIRIGLGETTRTVVIQNSDGSSSGLKVTSLENQNTYILEPGQRAIFATLGTDIIFEGHCQESGPFKIELMQENPGFYLSYDGKNYRGSLEIRLSANGSLIVINELPVEQYLYGVVPREIPASFSAEALKAQAVAARTYTYANLSKHMTNGYDLCSTTHCQVYGGVGQEDVRTNNAVDQTRGEVLTYDGKLISALYHASSGGHTENAENVWTTPLPYLKGVEDYDQDFPRYNWNKSFTPEEIARELEKINLDLGTIKTIEPWGGIGVSGRPISVKITGSRGAIEMKSNNFRTLFDLPSTLFTIDQQAVNTDLQDNQSIPMNKIVALNGSGQKVLIDLIKSYLISKDNKNLPVQIDNGYLISANNQRIKISIGAIETDRFTGLNQIVLKGKGWGHGLGMSQWGAGGLAQKGYNYKQILEHYYQGIELEIW